VSGKVPLLCDFDMLAIAGPMLRQHSWRNIANARFQNI
jgi:hypothetical protein